MPDLVPVEIIANKILLIRGQKVMIDRDLSKLYGVTTGNLNLAVRRNIERFPEDFMFQLTKEEFQNLILQFATSRWGGTRKHPFVFTEHGILMLSSVLNSDRAIKVNIQIMRAFVKVREYLATHKDVLKKLEEHDRRSQYHRNYFLKKAKRITVNTPTMDANCPIQK
ncbi:MAG: ORF6N domain-containing protein, partial [Candidatus Omnitrophica bacterium]|nr:ORF6N domain-containing protein [Candidatus Omnitrophota bacterium]